MGKEEHLPEEPLIRGRKIQLILTKEFQRIEIEKSA